MPERCDPDGSSPAAGSMLQRLSSSRRTSCLDHSRIAHVESSAASHLQTKLAVIRQARIIVELGHLERSERQHALFDLLLRSSAQPFELRDFDVLDTLNRLRLRHQTAQEDSVAKT